jgi:hypothetical protein
MSTREGQAGERHEGASEARSWTISTGDRTPLAVEGSALRLGESVEAAALDDVKEALATSEELSRLGAVSIAIDVITERFGKQGEGG